MRLDFYVRSSNLKKGKRPIKNPQQKPCAVVAGNYPFGFEENLFTDESYKCFRLTFAEACPFRGLSHKKFLGNFGYEIPAHDSVTFRVRM